MSMDHFGKSENTSTPPRFLQRIPPWAVSASRPAAIPAPPMVGLREHHIRPLAIKILALHQRPGFRVGPDLKRLRQSLHPPRPPQTRKPPPPASPPPTPPLP